MSKKKKPQYSLEELDELTQKVEIEKSILIKKAFSSDDPNQIWKAQSFLKSKQANIPQDSPQKSIIIDPLQISGEKYRDRNLSLSYQILRNMAKVPLVRAIIETRKEQIVDFCTPQKDKYSTGFIIRPKKQLFSEDGGKYDKNTQRNVSLLTDFIINCGDHNRIWRGDDFASFTRKFIDDSLILDQGNFEVIRNKKQEPIEFVAVDGATFRIAESKDKEHEDKYRDLLVDGYVPAYVQIYQNRVMSEFYPWELCFATRNQKSDIYSSGYGRSELEDLIEVVTSMLNADQYNSNYFRVGSNPKGILRVNGNINSARLEEFRTSWQATMTGVRNAHKLPIIEAEKMDFINTQASNKDMEYGKYQEYLIKVLCSIYKIDPSEVGFPMNGSSEAAPMFEGSNEARLKYSKDKGLKPMLSSYQMWLNKYILAPKTNGEYEFVFVGLDSDSPQQDLENDIKAVQNWSTINEIRVKRGMKPVDGGDIIANPTFLSAKMQEQQMEMYSQQQKESQDPITKALEEDLTKLFA